MPDASEPLFEPDASFAARWCVEDSLAQGALKHGSITVLDALEDARREAASASPDVGDFGPLGMFPRSVRAALTPLLVDKIRAAAIIVGWKLAQPGDPLAPGCIAEELALELIRQQAIFALELVEASSASLDATKGVYEVCQDDDVLDLFEMEEPADAALATTNPINIMMGKADMRVEEWFQPFYGGNQGFAPHPFYNERAASPPADRRRIEVIAAELDPNTAARAREAKGRFRVCIRIWEDDFMERAETNWLPDTWVYHLDASNVDEARAAALERFPHEASSYPAFDDGEQVLLDKSDLSRISIDVQRVHLAQAQKETSGSFHIVGTLANVPNEHLARLAGSLASTFSASIIGRDSECVYFGVNVYAESHEEAEADLDDAIGLFSRALGIEDGYIVNGFTCGQGERDASELLIEIQQYRVT
jgi:hypothetical protein